MKNAGWRKLFLFIMGVCVVGYTFYTISSYIKFHQLDKEIPLENITWDVFSKDEEAHLYKATYNYSFEGHHYSGSYTFKKPVFINVLGAKHALNEFSKGYQNVWISSQNPQHSAMEKIYPYKELVYTALLWAIFAYFLLLPKYCQYRYGSGKDA